MAFVDAQNTSVPELGQDNIFVHTACARGGMSGLFHLEIHYEQNRDMDKVAFPYSYTAISNNDMISTCIDQGDSADSISASSPLTTT